MHLVLSIYLCEFIIFVLEIAAYLVMFFYVLPPSQNKCNSRIQILSHRKCKFD
jgi:hypothetical protein